MLKKIIAMIMAVLMGSGCSVGQPQCGTGLKRTNDRSFYKDGKLYKNYSEDICDGFCYSTEENDDAILYVIDRDNAFSLENVFGGKCKTMGLLDKYNVKAGDFVEVSFDVQHISGGEAGISESELLKVYSCNTIPYSDAMKNGFITDRGIWHGRSVSGAGFDVLSYNKNGEKFFCAKEKGKFKVYTETSETAFDEVRSVEIPVTPKDTAKAEKIAVMVLCNKKVSDEDVINALKNGSFTQNPDIMLIGFASKNGIQTAETFANAQYHYLDTAEPSDDCRILITSGMFENGVTAEEAGLPDEVFENAYEFWKNMRGSYDRTINFMPDDEYDRDVVVFGGPSVYQNGKLTFDADGRMIADAEGTAGDCDWMIACVDGGFFDIFPF